MGTRVTVELGEKEMDFLREEAEADGLAPAAEADKLAATALCVPPGASPSGWDILWSLVGIAEGPPDGADRHDDYIYGTKRETE